MKKWKVYLQLNNSIPNALRDLHTSKCKRPHNRPYNACQWKLAKRNNFCIRKQLRLVANVEAINGNQTKAVICFTTCLNVKYNIYSVINFLRLSLDL